MRECYLRLGVELSVLPCLDKERELLANPLGLVNKVGLYLDDFRLLSREEWGEEDGVFELE